MKRILLVAFAVSLLPIVLNGQQLEETTANATASGPRSRAVTEAERRSVVTALEAVKAEDVPELIRKAEAGDVKAQWTLGVAYTEGKVVAKDYSKRWFWIQRSAETVGRWAQRSWNCVYEWSRSRTQPRTRGRMVS